LHHQKVKDPEEAGMDETGLSRWAATLESLETRINRISESLVRYRCLNEPARAKLAARAAAEKGSRHPLFSSAVRSLTPVLGGDCNTAALSRTIENADHAAALLDPEGYIRSCNSHFSDLFGFAAGELRGNALQQLLTEEYRMLFSNTLRSCSSVRKASAEHFSAPRSNPDQSCLLALRGRDAFGNVFSLEALLLPFGDLHAAVDPAGFVVLLHNITYQQTILRQFDQLKENYTTLSETINEAIIRFDEAFTIVFANSAVQKTFGYTKEELQGKNISILFPPSIYRRHVDEIRKYFFVDEEHRKTLGLRKTIETLGRHKSRGVSPMEISFGNSSYLHGRTLTCIIRDITQRKNTERQLRKLVYRDKLTGLGNRDRFNRDMRYLLEQTERYPMLRGALMFLDLDGFKQINDTMGHRTGDHLLLETSGRLRECLRESDYIYRFGGDEFVVLLAKIRSNRDAALVANKILSAIRRPFYLHSTIEHETSMFTIGVSIGIALFPDHGDEVDTLVKNADLAMYASKESGKNRFTFYRATMVSRAAQALQIEQGIKYALSNNLFHLHYQPLVDTHGRVRGFEALLRWRDERMGDISPKTFIPVAEEKQLIIPLGNWVLETAFRQLAKLQKFASKDLFLSVNLSALQLEQRNFLDTLGSILKRTGAEPERIKLELTETSLMRTPEASIAILQELKRRYPGIKILIDDFGTGYSSLSYLSRLPADALKIDLEFVSRLYQQNNRKIVNTILTLADSLQMGIVAEGVETEDQWAYFRAQPSAILQGFYFSHAVDSESLPEILSRASLAPSRSPQ
jgi:diguanylate cyclase (GGDEF)-like protein/PAS domain S-box-containing protein